MGLNRDLGRVPEVLTVSGSNIGISKTIPTAKLDINGDTIVTGSLRVTQGITGSLFGTSTTASFVNLSGLGGFVQGGNSFGTQALIGTNDNQSLALETSGSVRLTLAANGAATFSSNVTAGGYLANGTTTIGIPADTGGAKAYFDASSINGASLVLRADSIGRTIRMISDGSASQIGAIDINTTGLFMGTNTNHPVVFTPNAAERMRIAPGGNVGIGVSAPTSRLDLGNGTLTSPTLRGRTYTLGNVSSQNPNLVNGTEFNSIPVRVGDIIDFPFGQTRTVIGVTNTQLTLNANWSVSFAGSNVEGRGGIVFEANNAECIRITGTGNVGIGTTSPAYALEVNGVIRSTQFGGFAIGNTGGIPRIQLNSSTTFAFLAPADALAPILAASFNTSSDYRLKEDLKDYSGLDLVSQIKTYDYKWKSSQDRMYGVIAHELQEVLPYAVTGEKDAEDMQGVDYSKLVPILVQAIQELKAEIEILKNK